MGQEAPDRVELGGRPAVPVDGVLDGPHDARAVGSVQAHIDGVGTWCTITLAIPTLKGQLNAQSHPQVNKVPKGQPGRSVCRTDLTMSCTRS